jgi:hypothetical protein
MCGDPICLSGKMVVDQRFNEVGDDDVWLLFY